MGTVYLAEDENLGRTVALKVLSAAMLEAEGSHERFRREARSAARLAHPNIISVFHFGEVGGRPYFAMEYVEGDPLDELLRDHGPLPPGEAIDLAAQVVAGLAHAHGAGIIHRDLKAANLIRGRQGRVRILDFGLARAQGATSITSSGVVMGTPDTMSPEQGLGKRVDHRADIYSLGVVLFQLLTGRLPFPGDSALEVMMKHVQEPPPPLEMVCPELPGEVAVLVGRCLEKAREDRFQEYAELAGALEACREPCKGLPPCRPRDDVAPVVSGELVDAETLVGAPATPEPDQAGIPPSWFPPRHVPSYLRHPMDRTLGMLAADDAGLGRFLLTAFTFGFTASALAGILREADIFDRAMGVLVQHSLMVGLPFWILARLRGIRIGFWTAQMAALWTMAPGVLVALAPEPPMMVLVCALYHLVLIRVLWRGRADAPPSSGASLEAAATVVDEEPALRR
jgi:hypothetical protein